MDHSKELKIISLCSGMLGLEKGIELAGTRLRTVAYVEREAFINYNLARQMESGLVDTAPIWTDAKTFPAVPFRDRVHGIIGGYPCQGESLAGLRELENYAGFIWPYIFSIVKSSQPLFCFFENVGSHLSGTFPIVLKDLRSIGYKVEPGLFSAAEAGAPHQRKRLFILAYANAARFRRCLANTNSQQGRISEKSEWPDSTTAANSCATLVDSNCSRCTGNNEYKPTGEEIESEGKRSTASRANAEATVFSNSFSQRGQQGLSKRKTVEPNKYGSQWPAGPGQSQYEWEPPRVTGGAKTESGMGCRIDGYDFRADLLRMYGNGVCPPQAAIAWSYLTSLVP